MHRVGAAGQRPRGALALAYLSGGFGLGIASQLTFLVPLRAHELGASFNVIGLIVGAAALGPAVLAVSLGAAIDRLGGRRSFVLGTASTAILSVLFVAVPNYWWFMALQPVVGTTQTLAWVASQTYITNFSTAQERPTITGRFGLFVNVGQLAGPLLGGAVAELVGYRWALLLPAVYSACFVIVGLLLTETGRSGRAQRGFGVGSALRLLKAPGIQVVLLLTFSRLWINRTYLTFLPVFLVGHGLSAGVVGTVIATSGFVAAVTAPTIGYLTRVMSERTAAVLGLSCGALALLLAPRLTTLPSVYLVPVLVGIGGGVSLPLLLTLVAAAVPASRRGVAMGLRTLSNKAASTLAPILVGRLITAAGTGLGFVASGLVTLAILAASSLRSISSTAEMSESAQ